MKKIAIVKNNPKTIKEVTKEVILSVKEKKLNDRTSLSLHYGDAKGKQLLTLAQLKGSVANASDEGVYVKILPYTEGSSKVILQKITKSEFESIYTINEFKEKNENKTEKKPSKFDILYNSLIDYVSKCTDKKIKSELLQIIGKVEPTK